VVSQGALMGPSQGGRSAKVIGRVRYMKTETVASLAGVSTHCRAAEIAPRTEDRPWDVQALRGSRVCTQTFVLGPPFTSARDGAMRKRG
jgi:hypothetical protein